MNKTGLMIGASTAVFLMVLSVSVFGQQSGSLAVFDFMRTLDESKAGQEALMRLNEKKDVLTVVAQIAREKDFALVFELSSSGIAYFKENFDITAEVIRRYNSLESQH